MILTEPLLAGEIGCQHACSLATLPLMEDAHELTRQ
jgi:hypothetical protein